MAAGTTHGSLEIGFKDTLRDFGSYRISHTSVANGRQ
jgi:hypothetical protein